MKNHKSWEEKATKEQIRQRDEIEKISKEKHIPPSEIEYELINENKLSKNWAKIK